MNGWQRPRFLQSAWGLSQSRYGAAQYRLANPSSTRHKAGHFVVDPSIEHSADGLRFRDFNPQ